MPGPDLHEVGEGTEALETLIELPGTRRHGVRDACCLLEKVGAADIADEDEVSGRDPDRLVRGCRIGDEEAEVLRGVAWGVHHLDRDIADRDDVAVVDEHGSRFLGERVLPVGPTLGREEELRAGPLGELA